MKGTQTVLTTPPEIEDRAKLSKAGNKDTGQKVFAFDKSYWSFDPSDAHYAGQSDLHNDLGKPLLDNAFKGYNNCIFAYGQTGSGKSYSMMGYGQEAGVIPQICQDMFVRIEKMQNNPNLRCTVEVSYLEIYNERVRDLLNPTTKGNLKVREHPSTGPYVEDLAKLVVSSFNEIEHLMDEGNKARTVAATNMNETSSRSHAVFTLTVTQKRLDVETNLAMEKVAKISLVDLAGSERATSTGATGARLKEGAEINRSLSTLGRVIAALADLSDGKKKKGGKGAAQVPYRDSILTWLLKDSLGGNSMTAMIAAISPADINFDETLSTLRYADSAKRIKNHAVVNEDANARMIRELKEELEALRSKLGGGGIGSSTEETYPQNTPLDKQMVSITQSDGTVKTVSKAEIAEQLNQSEKLYHDLNQTWEEKLTKTEEIHKEREAALEELGISIEKGFVGLHTPKKMPHLVNLSDDPLLAECLVYNLKPGITTVGNVESNTGHSLEIRLNGSRILDEHCRFENFDNVVTLIPNQAAAVMVNGTRIVEPKRLRSGYRVVFGDFHMFRFNHPMEPKAERVQPTSLRHSIIANQIGDNDKSSPSQTPHPNHDRKISKAYSEIEGDIMLSESPLASQRFGDLDWSFARREAAGAILGPDKQIAGLTDEELNLLFEDVQKARAERAVQNLDDDMDSIISYPVREKYMSNGTLDNFSFDTALTTPSTPKQGESEDRIREAHNESQTKSDRQRDESSDDFKNGAVTCDMEEIKGDKGCVEASLREVKIELRRKLDEQRKGSQEPTQVMNLSKDPSFVEEFSALSDEEAKIVKKMAGHWRGRKYMKMVESILQAAAYLKEAQIISLEMQQGVFFQFTIIEAGHYLCSSYDMFLNGNSSEYDDPYLYEAAKPCVGVRVTNIQKSVIHLWSLEKLQKRVQLMRQMPYHVDKSDPSQKSKPENPFLEICMPHYTHIGDVEVPLSAVFERRVQDFTVDVFSPYTSQVFGILKLSLEPSSARAPSNMLKFNVVMHDLIGFAEREGTDVHAQMFLPGISEGGGVSTTQKIRDFDEGPIRFESVHSQSIPIFGSTDSCLRIAIFAQVSSMHIDKLLSWDDMQVKDKRSGPEQKNFRIAESHFFKEERHDIFTKVRILELAENGEYFPVKVTQNSDAEAGLFQLHQGLQRRIVVNFVHSSGDSLPCLKAFNLRVGCAQLVDRAGKLSKTNGRELEAPLTLVSDPIITKNANGTCSVTMIGRWDSSAHSSVILDRITADKAKIKIPLSWEISSNKLLTPISLSIDIFFVMLPRFSADYHSTIASLFQNARIGSSISGVFSVSIRPFFVKRAKDLWRINTLDNYIRGEDLLDNWRPRGVTLIRDYIHSKKHEKLSAEIEVGHKVIKKFMGVGRSITATASSTIKVLDEVSGDLKAEAELTTREKELLKKYIRLWKLYRDPVSSLITPSNTEPPAHVVTRPPPKYESTYLITGTTLSWKNPNVFKSGYLRTLSETGIPCVLRFVELRRPYLHVYSARNGEEEFVISLFDSRVDKSPEIPLISEHDENFRGYQSFYHKDNFFAIYSTDNTWLFMARNKLEKTEWLLRIEKCFTQYE